jgi:hypothetical protein
MPRTPYTATTQRSRGPREFRRSPAHPDSGRITTSTTHAVTAPCRQGGQAAQCDKGDQQEQHGGSPGRAGPRRATDAASSGSGAAALPAGVAVLESLCSSWSELRQEYEAHLATVQVKGTGSDGEPALLHNRHCTDLRLALIAHRRATVVRLRDQRHIDDTVLRRLQAALDNEEVRLTGRDQAE